MSLARVGRDSRDDGRQIRPRLSAAPGHVEPAGSSVLGVLLRRAASTSGLAVGVRRIESDLAVEGAVDHSDFHGISAAEAQDIWSALIGVPL
eukprot:9502482-Pyramimonas_sp.AAC.1